MTQPAAFFDLDKTVLAKSSSLAFAKPFYEGGLIRRADVVRSAYTQFVFLTGSADDNQMDRMRSYLTQLCKGWDVDLVADIVRATLDQIVDPIVHQEAIALMDEHHAHGRDVVIVSASGTEVVTPIAERLGADHAIGTKLEIIDGKYTGEIEFYAAGEHKVEAMQQLAQRYGYDLEASYAYSDSISDLPMLEAVGHPFVVNPDAELRAIAEERGWGVLTFARPVAMRRALEQPRNQAAAGALLTSLLVFLTVTLLRRRRNRTRF